ncbi:hypothetical protein CYMTET_29490 [Cymbomonas tetramitiformis]|uniref:Uncharacterized protein n=1 Tax=Cymbomonas tetramitiformis TaxID=36881 RepID=A0AAE0FMD0_9CHLO|nr:hypothetical protein CYMTET_29490 [Cymbomonas tetramitiformis]
MRWDPRVLQKRLQAQVQATRGIRERFEEANRRTQGAWIGGCPTARVLYKWTPVRSLHDGQRSHRALEMLQGNGKYLSTPFQSLSQLVPQILR